MASQPPGAKIFEDGVYKGVTPTTLRGLSLDEVHRFSLEKRGYYKKDVEVVFDEGRRREVKVELEPYESAKVERILEQSEALQQTIKDLARGKRVKKHAKKPGSGKKAVRTTRRPKGWGKLITSSNPVAKVFVDGKDTKRWTPIPPTNPLELPAGRHVIEYRASDGRSIKKTVVIEAGKTAKITGIRF